MKEAIHPIIYKCNDFVFYMETVGEYKLIHLQILKFSHTIFRHIKSTVKDIANEFGCIYGYGEEYSTYRLMRMAGFKKTNLFLYNDNHIQRKLLCLS